MDYRNLVRHIRRRNCENWPGKPVYAPVVSRYPNIAAEIVAWGFYLWCPAEHAGVTREIMAAVLEDNEGITVPEVRGLVRLFGRKAGFLLAPTLQVVDPATNKGKTRRRQLLDLPEGSDWRCKATREALSRGEAVTYSAWRRAVEDTQGPQERPKRERRLAELGKEAEV